MKKLVMAAILAGATVAFADEPGKQPAEGEGVAPSAEAKLERRKPTEEQMKLIRERREKFMAERKNRENAVREKTLAAIKKYGLDDEKAAALQKEIEDIMRAEMIGRPMMGGARRGGRPGGREGGPRPEAQK